MPRQTSRGRSGDAAAPRDSRRGAVRRVQPRALLDRCVDLPDRAAGRRRPARSRRRRGGDRDRPRGRGAGVAARRRHLAMRPDRRPRARHRLQPAHGPGRLGRCRGAAGAGRAGCGPRPAEPPAAATQAVLSGRSLDREPRHDRRHDRQQQLRLALAALRQHGAQRARRSTRCSPTGRAHGSARCPAISRPMQTRDARALSRPRPPDARSAPARSRRNRARFPQVLRRVGGYNIDFDRRRRLARRPQHGAAVGRLRGHPRLFQRDRTRTAADPGAPGARHLPFPELLQRDGGDAADRRTGSERGRAGRSHDDRLVARHPDVSRRRRPVCAGRAGGSVADRIRRRRPGGKPAAAARRCTS